MENIKIAQESSIKHSKVEPARKLNPQFAVVDGKVISEQEIIQQRDRAAAIILSWFARLETPK